MSSSLAHASGDGTVPGSRYNSAAGAAMGDAYLPLGADGVSALFYNPADFAKIHQAIAEPIHFQVNANDHMISNFGLNSYKVTSLSNYQPTLAGSTGNYQGVGASIFPNYVMHDFGFGVLLQNEMEGRVNSSGSITYRSVYQLIPTAGFGFRLAGGIVRIGYSAQWVNESAGTNTVPGSTSPLGYNQSLSTGSGISSTAGFALTLPIMFLPSVNFVARNIGGLNYQSFAIMPLTTNSIGTPANEPMSFDASFSLTPKWISGTDFHIVIEDRDITNTSGMSIAGRLALGIEFEVHKSIFLRGGWGDGYPCFGIGVKRQSGELSISRYTEEIGTYYHDLGDTRYVLEYQIRAF